jgi:peptidyl-prolyl cis-trans isomerase A (cyclophilin A)
LNCAHSASSAYPLRLFKGLAALEFKAATYVTITRYLPYLSYPSTNTEGIVLEENRVNRISLISCFVCLFWSGASLAVRPIVSMKTSVGEMTFELFTDKAPKTVDNFLSYTQKGFYEGTVFHRVISGFMIQGGGFYFENGVLTLKKTNDPIKNESKKAGSNLKGTISMARRGGADSATSQFFINHVDNRGLNYPAYGGGYTVFGKLLEGQDVLDIVAGVKVQVMRNSKGQAMKNVPQSEIKILSVSIKNKKEFSLSGMNEPTKVSPSKSIPKEAGDTPKRSSVKADPEIKKKEKNIKSIGKSKDK